jgi:hypothetical protein
MAATSCYLAWAERIGCCPRRSMRWPRGRFRSTNARGRRAGQAHELRLEIAALGGSDAIATASRGNRPIRGARSTRTTRCGVYAE